MKKIENILLDQGATIKEALSKIDTGGIKISLIVDESNKLIGTLSDGDIRRGLLKGLGLDDSIESIIFRNPTVCGINDSKEQILQKAIKYKLYQIPIINQEGVVVGIEEVDELLKPARHSNKVVLMVGGLGTRLRPLTNEKPKPLLEVGSKPILETIIENFAKYGFTHIILSVNYRAEMIKEYFGDGSKFNVIIEYVHETKRMGTAGALGLMRDKLTEPFFVMNGDLLTNVNFGHFFDYHISNNSTATMAVREYDFEVPYGVVNIEGQRIVSIEEKPVHSFFVSAGIYMLDPEVLEYISEDTFLDMPTLFEAIMSDERPALSFPIHEYWLDIGRINDFERANDEYHGIFT